MIVWLASYPRSGNTFFRSVLRHYFNMHSYSMHGDQTDIGANQALSELVGHEQGDQRTINLAEMRQSRDTHVIKTHHPPSNYMSSEDAVIYIVRDGRDSSVSYLNYLHKVIGSTKTSLHDVITGNVAFGLWGNHVLRWHQCYFKKIYRFKFEEITVDPHGLAAHLQDILKRKPSAEPFPELSRFSSVAPNFFGSGSSGSFKTTFTETDLALFKLYSGIGMRMAGYWQDDIQDEDVRAYSIWCNKIEQSANQERAIASLQQENANLMNDLDRIAKKNQKELDQMEKSYVELQKRYRKLTRYTGLNIVSFTYRKGKSMLPKWGTTRDES